MTAPTPHGQPDDETFVDRIQDQLAFTNSDAIELSRADVEWLCCLAKEAIGRRERKRENPHG